VAKLKAEGIGTVSGKLYVGTAESIPPSELVDTTGAGDAFIGAVIYGKFYSFAESFPYSLWQGHYIRMCDLRINFHVLYVYTSSQPYLTSLNTP